MKFHELFFFWRLLLVMAFAFPVQQAGADIAENGSPMASNQITLQDPDQKPERVVMARVGTTEITVEDFINFISLNPERVRAATNTTGKSEILKIMIANILLQKALETEGYLPRDRSPESFQKAMTKLADKYFPLPSITDEHALLAYYEANVSKFGIPSAMRISHIQFRFPKDADETAKIETKVRADAAWARLNSGEDFASLAREVSENPGSKDDGGDLGFLERGQWSSWLENALDGIGVGRYTKVLPSPIGYEILMVSDERQSITSPFEEVKNMIREHLQQEEQNKRQMDYVKTLAGKANIEIVLDELKGAYPNGIFP